MEWSIWGLQPFPGKSNGDSISDWDPVMLTFILEDILTQIDPYMAEYLWLPQFSFFYSLKSLVCSAQMPNMVRMLAVRTY